MGAAGDGADAQSWDISGAVPLQNLLASDSSLGLRGFQPKTHLAVADAIPVKSGAAIQRRAASPSSTASTSGASSSQGPSASAGSEAVAGANPFGESGADDAARGRGSSGAAAPALASASASEISSPIAATDVSQPFSSISVDPGQASTTSVGLDQLSDFIAEQASQMTGANEAATPLNAPQVVKELEISLDPADLVAVSLKLRLTGGKLSVVIGVSNASTLASIENDREAIASRLGVDPQSTDSLVIKAQGSSQVHGGGNDAIDPQDYSQSDARGGATADSASGQSGARQRQCAQFSGPERGAQRSRRFGEQSHRRSPCLRLRPLACFCRPACWRRSSVRPAASPRPCPCANNR